MGVEFGEMMTENNEDVLLVKNKKPGAPTLTLGARGRKGYQKSVHENLSLSIASSGRCAKRLLGAPSGS